MRCLDHPPEMIRVKFQEMSKQVRLRSCSVVVILWSGSKVERFQKYREESLKRVTRREPSGVNLESMNELLWANIDLSH